MMRYKIKQADESRNTTTTLTDDGELTVALEAGTTYFIDMGLLANSPATPQLKYAWVYTGTITSAALYESAVNATAPNTGGSGDAVGPCYSIGGTILTAPTSRVLAGGSGTLSGGNLRGVIVTNSSGNLKIQWSQNVSNASNTTVHNGSYIGFAKQADMDGTLLVKGSDTSRTNNTLTADPDLQFTTIAGKKYIVEMLEVHDASSVTPNFKSAFHDANVSLSAGFIQNTNLQASGVFATASATHDRGQWRNASFVTTPTVGTLNTQNTTNRGSRHILAAHQMGGSGGTLAYEWAQNVTNATPTILRAPAWLLYQEIL